MNKSALRQAILEQLRRELDRQVGAAHLARDEAISEESQPENKWDTHSQEAAYLAEGQARLAAEIGASLTHYAAMALPDFAAGDAIAIGALVELRGARGESAWYFIGPRAGGLEIQVDGRVVLVVTPQSPLGRQLVGRRVGDTLAVANRGGAQTIAAVL
ncbi:MAG TPA: transcription elongation factor [Opitutaceae bacterium]|nr:transcription elongation factor [Opitutaceae bacterium]